MNQRVRKKDLEKKKQEKEESQLKQLYRTVTKSKTPIQSLQQKIIEIKKPDHNIHRVLYKKTDIH